MRHPLADSYNRILGFIRRELVEKGYPPSVREICDGADIKSTSTVHSHLNTLEANGFLQKDPSKPRALKLLGKQMPRGRIVPIVIRRIEGLPIFADECIGEYVLFPSDLPEDETLFGIRITGDELVSLGFVKGDIVVAKVCNETECGMLVIASSDTLTVKNIEAGANMDGKYQTLGKVCALFRKF